MTQATVQPLFTNDLVGLIKILSIVTFTVLLPLGGLVVYFLKRGDADALNAVKADLNGLGSRVKEVEVEQGKLDEKLGAIGRTIATNQEGVMAAISRASEAQMRAVHDVEVSVARLEERHDIASAFDGFARSMEKLVDFVIARDTHIKPSR